MKSAVLLLAVLHLCHGLHILLFNPAIGHSHVKFMGRIGDILAAAGHNVTEIVPLVNPDDYKQITHLTTIHTVSQDPRAKVLNDKGRGEGGFLRNLWTIDPSPQALKKLATDMQTVLAYSAERAITETELWDKLRQEKFDVGITEAFDFTGNGIFEMIGVNVTITCSSSIMFDHLAMMIGVPIVPSYVPGIFEMIGVNVTITCSSSIMFDHLAMMIGVPIVPSYVPGGTSGSTEKMSMMERGVNAIGTLIGSSIFLGVADMQTEMFRKNVRADFKDIRDLVAGSSMIITNSLPYLDFPHPSIHKVIELGGIGINENKPLNEEWSSILNKSRQNVLISFGSVAKSKEMPQELKEGIIATVRRLPEVKFIWKYEADDLEDLPSNLLLSKWTPQSDLLADDRLSLFITHGGLASATEIAYGGTPAIVIPLFADQPRNGMMLKRQGVAESISKFEIVHPDKLFEVIKKMLDDPSYKENARKLSNLVNNVPFSPKEMLVKNVEFVGRFGKLSQLDPYGRQLSFVQYFLLDVVALINVLVAIVLFILFFIVRKLISCCFTQSPKSKKD